MENRVEAAVQMHKKGYNCAQAVVCAYCDLFEMDEASAFRMSEGFGGGMGGMQETCGAVTGMFMLAGMKTSGGNIKEGTTKKETYGVVKKLAAEFKEMNTSIVCRDLIGAKGAPKLRSCDGCIEDACKLVETYLLENKLDAEGISAEG